MNQSDQDFREQFKPVSIPSSYDPNTNLEDRILFTLALIGQGSAEAVMDKMNEIDAENDAEKSQITDILNGLYEKGLIKGTEVDSVRKFDLSKITQSNTGYVDPELLAPGLD